MKLLKNNKPLLARRNTDNVELSESDMPDDKFNEYFKKFEEEPLHENESSENNSEKWFIKDYQILQRKDADFTYLAIIYKDKSDDDIPALFAFRDETHEEHESKPTCLHNIHGTDVYQSYLDRGWNDITHTNETYPWVIKSWLAQHMKPDTI